MGGLLISLHMTMQEIFLFAAMPSILATIAMLHAVKDVHG
jgi:hypothetical protein